MEWGRKRIRSGRTEFVKDGGVKGVQILSEVVRMGAELEVGGGVGDSGERVVSAGSQELGVYSVVGCGLGGEEKELKNLVSDLLVEVLKFIPQEDLFEVMLVSRQWEEVVREASVLWRKVEVTSKWEVGVWTGRRSSKRENGMIRTVVGVAEDIKLCVFDDLSPKHIKWVIDVVGLNLRRLELLGESVHPNFFPRLLTKCPDLESLVVEGDCMGRGPVRIRHAKLETLQFWNTTDRLFVVECPRLTHLVTDCVDDNRCSCLHVAEHSPSFNCPQLTALNLSRHHSTPVVLQTMADHAPNIKSLHVDGKLRKPPVCVTLFNCLQDLRLYDCGDLPPNVLTHLPQLECLYLWGKSLFPRNLKVCHQGLRSLNVINYTGLVSLELGCPSLESLELQGRSIDTHFLENLHSSCPKLKRVRAVRTELAFGVEVAVKGGSLELNHETVEEFELIGFTYAFVRITCHRLKKLDVVWVGETHGGLPLVEADCPSLTDLLICGYKDVSLLSLTLHTLPSLQFLKLYRIVINEGETVLSHSNIQKLVFEDVVMKKIVVDMPELVYMFVTDARVKVLQVASKETVTLESTQFGSKGSYGMIKLISGGDMLNLCMKGKDGVLCFKYGRKNVMMKQDVDVARIADFLCGMWRFDD